MLQELQVDTRNKEEEVVSVTSSADLIPAYPGQVPMTDKGIPNPCLSSVGPGMQEAEKQPHSPGQQRIHTWSWGWAGMLHVVFKAAGDLSLVCDHQVSLPKHAPRSGRSRLPPASGQFGTPPHLLWCLKQRFFSKPGS